MGILVVGSIGLDTVHAPAGTRERILGGTCVYFSTAAGLYTDISVVGVVGSDFCQEHVDFLQGRGIDLRGLQRVEGKTFFWEGRYSPDVDDAETLDTQLGVFAEFHPVIPEDLRDTEYVFLANIDPDLQLEVLEQMRSPRLVVMDSMNFWITGKRDALTEVLKRVDVAVLNETEVRMYSEMNDLMAGGQYILDLGPKALIIKRGAHGAMLLTSGDGLGQRMFVTPAYPLDQVVDPTGAGDTFAAGFCGYLARSGDLSAQSLRRAVVHGAVVGSFTVQDFSVGRLRNLSMDDIQERYHTLRCMTHFDALDDTDCSIFRQPLID